MKRFVVLMVLTLAMALLLSGTAMAYTDYIPFLSKGTTGAVRATTGNTDNFGTLQNEAPAGMPNTYDAYALGCFWCHGWEKRKAPNTSNVVDLTTVLTSPSVQIGKLVQFPDPTVLPFDYYVGTLMVPAGTNLGTLNDVVVQALGGELNTPVSLDELQGLTATTGSEFDNVAGETLVGPVAGSRWTNLAMQYGQPYGPHGGYSNTTDRCKVCHDVHAAAGNKRLTAGSTAEDICETCHDFTQGISIYGAIEQATGVRPAGGHRIQGLWEGDQTTDTVGVTADYTTPEYLISGGSASNNGSYNTSSTLIPGYMPGTSNQLVGGVELDYPQTGGVYTYTSASLASRENQLTCTDCHTPHGNTSMRPFKGDRVRLGSAIIVSATLIQPLNINTITLPMATVTAITPELVANDGHLFTGTVAGLVAAITPLAADTDGDSVDDAYRIPLSGATAGYLVDVLQAVGEVPWGTAAELNYGTPGGLDDDLFVDDGDAIAEPNEGLKISPSTPWGQRYNMLGVTHIPFSGVALAVQLYLAGALDLHIGLDGVDYAVLTRMPSNKLLRDFVNQLDLRSTLFGGAAPGSNGAPTPYWDVNGGNNYDQTIEAPLFSGGGVDPSTIPGANDGNPYNNGQMGATAEYGSGFCAACHRGRIGNFAGLVDLGDAASVAAARLDIDFENIEAPPNAEGYPTGSTFSDALTCTNHPTLMKLPYRMVGPMTSGYNDQGTSGNPGTYNAPLTNGLALSNQGFTFWPVNADLSTTDGKLGISEAQRPTAPICQQCHEDSRDVESQFAIAETDKSVPMNGPVNIALGLINGEATTTGLSTGIVAMTPGHEENGEVDLPFIYSGNPLFQNFPHETQNYRLLVEGGDSNQVLGGRNDDLCLNCHVPGSIVRPDQENPVIIFTTLVKDFNGFQE